MIGVRTAFLLYAALAIFALITLKGKALAIALIIVAALAAKTLVHHLRQKLQ